MKELDRGTKFQIQLPNGNVMDIPTEGGVAPPSLPTIASKGMNISEELNRSGVWKNVNIGNVLPEKPTCRNNRRRQK